MARFRQIACVLLVALWLPATLHCNFEALGFDEIFHCATDHHAPASADACADPCEVVENGWIKRASSEIALATPTLHACLICFVAPPVTPFAAEPPPPLSASTAAPPEIGRTWQFLSRAAPPPRAPSLAS